MAAALRLLDRANALLLDVLAVCLGLIACIGFAQVVFRYLLGTPLVWSEEAIRFGLIWLVFLGAGIAARRGALIALALVPTLVPSLERPLRVLALLVCLVFWGAVLVQGIALVSLLEGLTTGALSWPMDQLHLALPVGAAIALLNTVAVLLDPPRSGGNPS